MTEKVGKYENAVRIEEKKMEFLKVGGYRYMPFTRQLSNSFDIFQRRGTVETYKTGHDHLYVCELENAKGDEIRTSGAHKRKRMSDECTEEVTIDFSKHPTLQQYCRMISASQAH